MTASAEPMLPAPFVVRRVLRETHDTFTLELVPASGPDRFAFQPGQFNMLYVYGVGEVPISLSGDPGADRGPVHTLRAVGAVTDALRRLRGDSAIGVRGPFGSAWPVEEAEDKDVVIVAGGIGLAPLRPAILHVLAHRRRYQRVTLLYGARTPRDILYRPLLRRWSSRLDVEVMVTVDRASDDWRGNVGVVTTLIPAVRFDPAQTAAFVCGPEIMMRFVVRDLEARGLSKDRIHVSLERNMKCAVGFCGHCQFGTQFVCKDGPVFRFDRIERLFAVKEL